MTPLYLGKTKFFYLVEVRSETEVHDLKPDFEKLKLLPASAVIVTSVAETEGYDFVSRCFAPNVGIDEDPVTGSAHCCLGPFWSERFGKEELMAYQASERGGTLRTRVESDRVFIGGRAVTILHGVLVSS